MGTTTQQVSFVTGYKIKSDGTADYSEGTPLAELTSAYAPTPFDESRVWGNDGKQMSSIPRYVNGAWTYPALPTYIPTNDDIARQREAQYRQRSDSSLLAGLRKLVEAGTLPDNEDLQTAINEVAKIKAELPY